MWDLVELGKGWLSTGCPWRIWAPTYAWPRIARECTSPSLWLSCCHVSLPPSPQTPGQWPAFLIPLSHFLWAIPYETLYSQGDIPFFHPPGRVGIISPFYRWEAVAYRLECKWKLRTGSGTSCLGPPGSNHFLLCEFEKSLCLSESQHLP